MTPNADALSNQFVQFDNFYDPGTLSADGHNWLMQADANDYIEKEFGAFARSYPASGADALAYQRDGFLWNAAARAGKTVSAFAGYANFFNLPAHGAPSWSQWYKDSQILQDQYRTDHRCHRVGDKYLGLRWPCGEGTPRFRRPCYDPVAWLQARSPRRGRGWADRARRVHAIVTFGGFHAATSAAGRSGP